MVDLGVRYGWGYNTTAILGYQLPGPTQGDDFRPVVSYVNLLEGTPGSIIFTSSVYICRR